MQARILRGLKPDGVGVTVVGDDAQAIYSFRAATVRNILDFPSQYDPPARIVTLERNYRSTQPILDASNAVIGLASERFTKNLRTERVVGERPVLVSVRDEADQARCVAERVLAHRENAIALKNQAVLFRSSSHSAQLELELARRNIPYVKFGGLKFLEAAHIKDVLALLRWAENARSRVAGYRAARLVARRRTGHRDPVARCDGGRSRSLGRHAGSPHARRGGVGLGDVARRLSNATGRHRGLAGRDRRAAARGTSRRWRGSTTTGPRVTRTSRSCEGSPRRIRAANASSPT